MSDKPGFADMLGPEISERMSRRRRRSLTTQDGTTIARGESYPIAGLPIAMDARPAPSSQPVTFDGAMPTTDNHKD